MFHLWGLPFRPDGPQLSGFLSSQQREPSILDSLRWTLKSPSLRREGFPSWSWAGWFGEITWPKEFNSSSDHFWKSKRDLVPIDISVETVDGKILPFDVFRQNYAALSPSSSYLKPIIRVSALTRNATRLVADHDNALFEPRFIIDGGGRRIIRVSTHVGISGSSTESVDLFSRDLAIFTCVATTKEFLDVTDSYLAIFLAVQELEFNVASTKYRIELMIVKQKRAIWERVALGKIDIDGSENHNIVDGISSESRREIVLG
jgi:hypothetical protein